MKSAWLAGVLVALVLPSGVAAQTTYSSGGLACNGIGWLSVPSGGTALQNSTAFTIEAWVSTNFTGVAQQVLVQKPNSYLFKNQAGVLTFEAQLNPGNVTRTVSWPSALWTGFHHVAATFDSTAGVLRLYVDGVLRDSVTGLAGNTLVQSNANFRVGGTPGVPGSDGWNGTIDELRVWSLRRSTSEINAAKPRALRQMPGLELVFSGDDGPGNSAIPNPLVDGTGQRSGAVNGTVVFGAGAVFSAYPGTGADLQLSSSSGGAPLDLNGDKAIRNGDAINFSFESPEGAYVNAPFFWVVQLPADGVTPAPVPGAPDLHIDLFQPYEVVIPGTLLPATGFQFAGTAPLLFTQNLWSQGVAVTPVSPTGYAATDAHLFRFSKSWFANPVAPSGGSGTRTAPFNTLAAALNAASPGDNVFLAVGTFNETLTFDQPINLYGRYNPVTWVKYANNFSTTVSSSHRGTSFAGITDSMSINDVIFVSADGLPPGSGNANDRPSVAVDIRDCSNELVFNDCRFESGTGAAGSNGLSSTASGNNGANGSSGANGDQYGANVFPQAAAVGGNGPGYAGSGGIGGRVLCTTSGGLCYSPTYVNGGSGGNGTSASPCPTALGGAGADSYSNYPTGGLGLTLPSGYHGSIGSDGAHGAPGFGGATNTPGGYLNSNFRWRPNIAFAGATGNPGCSGGGGGGGSATGWGNPGIEIGAGYATGGGGGGGGQGGLTGGAGGEGAEEGAPSVAAWLVNSSPVFDACQFHSGLGGQGGTGGNGAPGGQGGSGGNGGQGGTRYSIYPTFDGGNGGSGGDGGDAGQGGGGGGGCGGASWSVVRAGSSSPTFINNVGSPYVQAGGGLGGVGGSQNFTFSIYRGATGATGEAANFKDF